MEERNIISAPAPEISVEKMPQQPTQSACANSAPRLLLLAVFVVGVAWRLGWSDTALSTWGGWYGAFWLVAMAAVTPFLWRRVMHSRTAIALGVAAVALCVLWILRADNYNEDLVVLSLPGIPCAMLLYLVFAAYNIPVRREGAAAQMALTSVFVYPFTGVPMFFRAICGLFSGHVRGAWKRTLLGVVIGLPLAACVTWLLMQGDANMSRLFSRLFTDVPLTEWFTGACNILFAAMLFYGVFERAVRREKPPVKEASPASWPLSTMVAVLVPSLVVYALFVCLQFSYLFGGTLPQALTYSQYARQGFMELNLVAAINFTLFGLTQRYAKPHRILDILCALLLAATLGIVASCIVRLLLYIGAYGLTMMRILPLWLAAFLAALTVLCAIRLEKKRLPVLRTGGIAFVYWFVLLNLPDWNAVIAAYNAAHRFS